MHDLKTSSSTEHGGALDIGRIFLLYSFMYFAFIINIVSHVIYCYCLFVLLKCTNLPSKRASDDRLAVNFSLFLDEEYIFFQNTTGLRAIENATPFSTMCMHAWMCLFRKRACCAS